MGKVNHPFLILYKLLGDSQILIAHLRPLKIAPRATPRKQIWSLIFRG